MEKRGIVLFFVAWLACCSISTATVTNLNPGESVNLANYVGANSTNSILIADKLFGEFNFIAGGNTNVFGSMTINLTAISNSFGYGIRISAPFHAQDTQLKDFIIDYSVQVTNAPFLISDLHLDYNGSHFAGGFSSVTESVFTGGFGVNQIDQAAVFDPPPGNLMTNIFLATPQAKIYIEKDIQLGGNNNGDVANISAINQVFSQVQIPEPSSMTLGGNRTRRSMGLAPTTALGRC